MARVGSQIVADEPGLGKSAETIAACALARAKRILVVCPGYLKYKWKDEFNLWWPEVNASVYTPKKSLEIIDGVTITSYESIRPKKNGKTWDIISGSALEALLKYGKFDILVVDEAHQLANRKCAQYTGVSMLSRKVKASFLLTGTPIRNKLMDIWSLLHICSPKTFTSYWNFAKRYAGARMPHFGEVGWQVEDHTTDPIGLRKAIEPWIIRRQKSQVLKELPPKILKEIRLDMTGEQKRLYDEINRRMMAEIEEGGDAFIITPNMLAKTLRLKQIAVSPRLVGGKSNGVKMDTLMEIIRNTDGKLVVFSQFPTALNVAEQIMLENQMSYEHVMISGGVNQKDKDTAIREFQNNQEIKLCFATMKAIGLGIELTAASTAVFLDKWWTPDVNTQAEDRLHRIGQHNPVVIITLWSKGKSEQHIENMISDKAKIPLEIWGQIDGQKV